MLFAYLLLLFAFSIAFSLLEPGKVSDLVMENLSDRGVLKITWTPPSGEWEHIRVVLVNGSEILVNQTVDRTAKEILLSWLNLQPGRVYSLAVSVENGGLANTVYYEEEIGNHVSIL